MTNQETNPKRPSIVYGNGIHARKFDPNTGKFAGYSYQWEPKTVEQLSQIAQKTEIVKDRTFGLMKKRKAEGEASFGFPPSVKDFEDLSQMGWGLVFPASMAESRVKDILDALQPLIDRRKDLTNEKLFQVLSGPEKGVRPSDTAEAYLKRFGLGPGAKKLDQVPGYLLLIGDPNDIPFRVQYQLAVDYYVGRLYFNPESSSPDADLQQYRQYATNVVQVEERKAQLARTLRFFRPDNNGDPSTSQSATSLVQSMADILTRDNEDWDISALSPAECTQARLQQLAGGPETPALLFTASHGMAFDPDDAYQAALQGSLICQDWQGKNDDLERGDLFAAEDLLPDANLLGSMAFLFACYGAGTPQFDNFIDPEFGTPQKIANRPFLSALPQKLLNRGALAVMGHVDRAWTYSFLWDEAGAQTQHFEWTLTRLMAESRVGYALDYFSDRYSIIATDLVEFLDKSEGTNPNSYDLVRLWTANNDARDYVLIGDPACSLSLAAESQAQQRPSITVTSFAKNSELSGEQPVAKKRAETRKAKPPAGKQPEQGQEQKSSTALAPTVLAGGAYEIHIRAQPDGNVSVQILPAGLAGVPGSQSFGVPGAQDFGKINLGNIFRGAKENVEELKGKLDEAQENLTTNLGEALKTLGEKIKDFADDVSSLEIDTYTSRSLANSSFDRTTKKFTNADLRAKTRLNIDGDAYNLVPLSSTSVDKELWEIHLKMVEIAQTNRTEMIKAIAELISRLRPGGGG